MTRVELETALDQGRVQVLMSNGNWWRLRRNGQTKTWKRDTVKFRIPVKAGLRAYAYVDNHNLNSGNFRIVF